MKELKIDIPSGYVVDEENSNLLQGVRSVCVNLESGGYLYVNDLNNFTETLIKTNVNKINTYEDELKELRKEFSEL